MIKDEEIIRIDLTDELAVLDSLPKQLEDGLNLGVGIKVSGPFKNIIICGMGGSALPGEIVQDYVAIDIPMILNNTYTVPKYVGRNSLVFCISYSGNTEETLEAYEECKKRNATIVVISSDGKLKELAVRDNTSYITVPSGIQPRDAGGYMTVAILNVLANARLIANPQTDVIEAAKAITPTLKEHGREIAQRLVNRIPIIYSSHEMKIISRLWKIKFNENSKIHAFANEFPEFNHNEIQGYENIKGNFYVIILRDKGDHPRIQKRMDILKKIIQEEGVPVLMINITGKNKLAKIFMASALGSYVAFYLAMEYRIDPAPVRLVESLKKDLKK